MFRNLVNPNVYTVVPASYVVNIQLNDTASRVWHTECMSNEMFSKAQIEQLRTVIKDEVRPIVREEARAQIVAELESIHVKLDGIRGEAREGSDALAATVVLHGKRFARIEKRLDKNHIH